MKRKYLRQGPGVCEFMKFHYITHLSHISDDPLHEFKFALLDGKSKRRHGKCKQCQNAYTLIENIVAYIMGSETEAAMELLE